MTKTAKAVTKPRRRCQRAAKLAKIFRDDVRRRGQSAAAQDLSITDAGRNLSGVKLIAGAQFPSDNDLIAFSERAWNRACVRHLHRVAISLQPETRPIGPLFDRIEIAVQAYERSSPATRIRGTS